MQPTHFAHGAPEELIFGGGVHGRQRGLRPAADALSLRPGGAVLRELVLSLLERHPVQRRVW